MTLIVSPLDEKADEEAYDLVKNDIDDFNSVSFIPQKPIDYKTINLLR